MAMQHSSTADSFTPTELGDLVDLAVKAKSIAARSATVFTTDKVKVSFPKWVADPNVAFYNELDEISITDGDTDEVSCIPTKTAGLSLLSNELRDDSSPAVADLLGAGLANKIGRAIDQAYLSNTTAKGPDGLLSIDYTPVAVGTSLVNLDAFISGRYAAEAAGSQLTSWIVRPAVAEQISKLKTAAGANTNLIEFVEDGITIAGLPVLVSDQVDADTVAWGVPSDHVKLVMRAGTTVERFPAVTQDGTYVRAVSRLGLAFLNEPGVVRLMLSPIEFNLNLNGATGGTFTLSLNGHGPSATIAFGATNTTVKSTLAAIDDGIDAADITVTGSGGVFSVTVPGVLTANGASLTGGTPSATATVTVA